MHGRRGLGVALAWFILVKAAFVGVLWLREGGDPTRWLLKYDATWYPRIVNHGYVETPGENSPLAFFPLVPDLVKAVTGLGVPAESALLAVSVAGSALAVVGIWLVGREAADARVATWLAMLWVVAPRSHVLAMGYTEGAFTAAAAFALLGILQRRWALAGTAGLLAGLIRPTAAPLIATLGLVWLVDVWLQWRRTGRLRPFTASLWALVASVAGFLGWLAYVGWRTGSPLGYLRVQAGWNQRLGTPLETLNFYLGLEPGQPGFQLFASVGLVVLGYLGLWLCMFVTRERWPLIVFASMSLLLVACQQNYYYYYSARFLLPTFPLWLPAARLLARMRIWGSGPLIIAAAVGTTIWSVSVMLSGPSP